MFNTLRAEMVRKRISAGDLATAVGMSRQALYRKMNGLSQFSLSEAKAIRDALDIDVSIDDLFEVTER